MHTTLSVATSPRMTPAEVVFALRAPVHAAAPPRGALPPTLSNPLIWQVGLRVSPLPSAPDQRFDAFRSRVERAGSPRQSTLDIRVTESNGRDVRQVPERRPQWRGPLTGNRLAEAVESMRQGTTGWSEFADFASRARTRLEAVRRRWTPLQPAHPARARLAEALRALDEVVGALAKAAAEKRVDALPPLAEAARQAQQAMNLARGRD